VGNSVLLTDADKFEINPCGFRVTFYRGLYDYGSGDVPVGSSLDYDSDGNTWDSSLYWNGDKGLYNKRWKPFVEFMMRSKRTSFDVRVTANDLFNFSPDEKLKYENSRYLPFNLSLTLTGQNFMSGEATLYRL
jgi:hypothetical protein